MIHPETLGHRLHRLPPPVQHQPPQVQATIQPLLTTPERHEHLTSEILQPTPNGIQLRSIHTKIIPHKINN
jgi:hypothetical protein